MENNREYHIGKTDFDAFVHAVGSEIEQAQVRLITAANAQMLFHYWKMGNYISCIIKTCKAGEAKSSSNWLRLSVSIILKRKAIRSATLPICANLHGHIR